MNDLDPTLSRQPHRSRPGPLPNWKGYALALVSVALAVWLRRLLDPVVGLQFPFPFVLFAVLLTAWFGGWRPALASALIGTLAVSRFLLPPRASFVPSERDQAVGLALFLATSVGIAWLGGAMHAAQSRFRRATREIGRHEVTGQVLRAREAQLRAFVQQAPVSIVMLDRELRYVVVSQRWLEDAGQEGERLEGRSHYDVVPDIPEHWRQVHRRCLEGAVERNADDAFVRADGSIQWLRWEVRPWYDALGASGGIIIFSEDITPRRKAEEALRNSEERQRVLLEGVKDYAIFMLDPEGRIATWNRGAEAMFGYRESEIVGQDWSLLFLPEDAASGAPRAKLEAARVVASEECIGWRLRQDGSRFWGSGVLSRLNDGDRLLGFSKVLRDHTEDRRLEEQLRQSQKMEAVGQLAGGVAHDFNNLMTIVTGYSDLVLELLPKGDPSQGYVREVHRAGERAATLTRQLLAFSRRQMLAPKLVDLNSVISDSEKTLKRLLGEDVLLASVLDPNLMPVRVDPGQMTQVFINLAVNAREAMARGGSLVLETRNVDWNEEQSRAVPETRAGRYACLSVSDTGCGMGPEVQAHAFEPFFTTKGPAEGTGMGLSTVFGIVKQSGGHITLDSEVGVGSTVRIYLPVVEAEEDPLPKPSLPTDLARRARSRREAGDSGQEAGGERSLDGSGEGV